MRNFRVAFRALTFVVVFFILAGSINYFLEPVRTTTRILLQELYTQEEEITTLFVGASRFRRGIDPYILDEKLGGNTFLLSFGSQTPIDSYYLIKEAFKEHTPQLVVLDMSYGTLTEREEAPTDMVWAEIKPSWDKVRYFFAALGPDKWLQTFFPVFSDASRLQYLADDYDIAENYRQKKSEAYLNYDFSFATTNKSAYAGKGYIYIKKPLPKGTLGDVTFATWAENKIDKKKLDYYNKTIDMCKEKGVPVILLDMPMPYASMAGQKNYTGYYEYVTAYAESHDIPYINLCFLKTEYYTRDDSYFFDRNHMSYKGSQKISPLLGQIIDEYRRDDLDLSDYLYSTYEETIAENPHIYSTWLVESTEEEGFLEARTYCGTGVVPLFEFQYKKTIDDEYKVIRKYDEVAKIDISKYKTGFIRVNCKSAGSKEEWEQYFEYIIGEMQV